VGRLGQCKIFASSVLEFSFYSLSLSHTLWHLEFSWNTLGECGILGFLEQEGKGIAGWRKRTSGSTTTTGFSCSYQVSCMFSSLILACVAYACGLLVMIYHCHGGLPRLTLDLPSLAIYEISMVLKVHFFVFLVGSHVSFSLGWVTSS